MDTNLVVEGFKFMGLGMGAVFLFLVVLIFLMGLMSNMIHKYFPEVQPSTDVSRSDTGQDQKKVIAAITAAIKFHRES